MSHPSNDGLELELHVYTEDLRRNLRSFLARPNALTERERLILAFLGEHAHDNTVSFVMLSKVLDCSSATTKKYTEVLERKLWRGMGESTNPLDDLAEFTMLLFEILGCRTQDGVFYGP